MADQGRRNRILAMVAGGVVGGIVGALVAVNLMIYFGTEAGYEASLPEIFEKSAVLGVIVVAVLVAGPIVGGWAVTRMRAHRSGQVAPRR
ncbi:MAG TPA: hypothetical protein VFZ80_00890 [Acidimicrobiia bacterium]